MMLRWISHVPAAIARGISGDRDGFLQALANAVTQHLGAQAAALMRRQITELDGNSSCSAG